MGGASEFEAAKDGRNSGTRKCADLSFVTAFVISFAV